MSKYAITPAQTVIMRIYYYIKYYIILVEKTAVIIYCNIIGKNIGVGVLNKYDMHR